MFMPYHLVTLVRFQKWDDVMKYPQPAPELKITNAIWRTARGIALADTGKPAEAEKELAAFREVVKTIPADAGLGNSSAHGVMKVAEDLLVGEIATSKDDMREGIEALRRSVAAEDLVNYNEPPDWDLPIREWLGRALMRNGEYAEAEKVYRDEIAKQPRSGRALFGLAEALERQGKSSSAALVRKEFEKAWSSSDTKLTAEQLYGKPKTVAAGRNRIKLKTGVTLSYVETGNPNGPAVVLLHGFTDSSFSYSRILPLLDKRYRYFAIDQRGHGDSERPETGYEMKHFASDVAAFLEAKGVEKAVVVGHSMGSFVAMQTALDSPQRVERLVLIGTATTARNKLTTELQTELDKLHDPVPADFAREFQVSSSSPTLPKEFIDTVVAESLKLPARVWRSAFAGVLSRDYKPELSRIKVPVAIFWGRMSRSFSAMSRKSWSPGFRIRNCTSIPEPPMLRTGNNRRNSRRILIACFQAGNRPQPSFPCRSVCPVVSFKPRGTSSGNYIYSPIQHIKCLQPAAVSGVKKVYRLVRDKPGVGV
jgi:pimeloyl-ACP methyl ester carboxylesterase